MKKNILVLIFCFLSIQFVFAQANTINTTGKFGSQIFLSDVYGRAFENKYADINGSAFFMTDYKYATIVLSDGRTYYNVKSKLNLLEHEIAFIASNGVEGSIGKGMAASISFIDTTKQGIINYFFKSGFSKIDNQSNLSFYQVLTTGKLTLLKSINKMIEERGNELSGEKYKEFVTRENWYIQKEGVLQRIKREKAFILTLFPSNSEQMNAYISANKLNFKSDEQLIKLVDYYNSL